MEDPNIAPVESVDTNEEAQTDVNAAADATETPAVEPKAPKPPKDSKNGVTMPAPGTKTRRIWDIADEISQSAGRPALRGEVMDQSRKESLSDGTAGTQYGRWMTYHGVTRDDLNAVRDTIREANKPVVEPTADGAEPTTEATTETVAE